MVAGGEEEEEEHAALVKSGMLSSIFLHNHLLNMYCKNGGHNAALQLFVEMPCRNVASRSCHIGGLVQRGRLEMALAVFQAMRRDGGCDVLPNEFTLSVINACSLSDDASGTYQVFVLFVKLGFESNVFLMNAFITAFIRHGKVADAVVFFWNCPVRDTVLWNAVIAGYLQFSYSKVWSFWCRMVYAGVRPDHFTLLLFSLG